MTPKENNGWIEITLGTDLPKNRCDIWVLCKGKVYYYSDFDPESQQCFDYLCKNYTHYQTVIKPNPPA